MPSEQNIDKSKLNLRSDLLIETLNADMGYFFRSEKVLHESRTTFQDLEVHETPRFGKMLRLDGVFQTSEKDEFLYHEPLAHVPGIAIDGPKTALVIGGGDGGAAEEILKYPTIEKVVMVELDGGVVEACKKHIPEICKNTFNHPKFELRIEDGIKYVQNAPMKFDQVFIDLTDPFGPSIELYTVEFYKAVAALLTDRAAIGLHIESPVTRPELFSKLYYTLKEAFSIVKPMTNYVPFYGTLWGYAYASNSVDPTQLSPEEVNARIKKHKLDDLQFYNEDTHFALMALPNWIRNLLKEKVAPIHSGDQLPVPAGSERNLVLGEVD